MQSWLKEKVNREWNKRHQRCSLHIKNDKNNIGKWKKIIIKINPH